WCHYAKRAMLHCNRPKRLTYGDPLRDGEKDGRSPPLHGELVEPRRDGLLHRTPSCFDRLCMRGLWRYRLLLACECIQLSEIIGGELPGHGPGVCGHLLRLRRTGDDAGDERVGGKPAHGKFEDGVAARLSESDQFFHGVETLFRQ